MTIKHELIKIGNTKRVVVICPNCNTKRTITCGAFKKLQSGNCINCARENTFERKSQKSLDSYKKLGEIITPLKCKILFNEIELPDRKNRAKVPVICVCGKKFKTKASSAFSSHYTGLCGSCSIAYKSWLNHKKSPTITQDKYIYTSITKDEPFSDMGLFRSISPFSVGRIAVHRKTMAEYMNRSLLPEEHVHHIDGNKFNNEIDNLLLINPREHSAITQMETYYENKIKALENKIKSLESKLTN